MGVHPNPLPRPDHKQTPPPLSCTQADAASPPPPKSDPPLSRKPYTLLGPSHVHNIRCARTSALPGPCAVGLLLAIHQWSSSSTSGWTILTLTLSLLLRMLLPKLLLLILLLQLLEIVQLPAPDSI